MLELRNITKDYLIDNKPHRVLHGIDLSFGKSGFVAILGPSGCGKTTLLNIIGGLDKYTEGDLIIDDKTTKSFKSSDWDAYRNNRIGFVFQTYNLVPHLNVIENVELSLTLVGMNKKERMIKAREVLQKVGLGEEINKKPNQLSGGQMQRVAIARALVNDPDIILADEPTGALDSTTSIQVMDLLSQIAKNKLVIMVTHNVDIANRYANRIINLNDGKVVGDSSNEQIVPSNTELSQEENKKTKMSFFTAAKISLRNLFAKKGRTIITTVATSFGIIGVALVLALSNGFQIYVHDVEVATANSLPLTISRISTKKITTGTTFEKYPDNDEVICYDPDTSLTGTYHFNTFSEEYINYVQELKTNDLASSVLVNHSGLKMNLLSKLDDDNIVKVNENGSTGSYASTLVGAISDLPTSVWHELYGDEDFITSMYDVISGEYPQNKNEVCLIVDQYNRVYKKAMVNLGLCAETEEKVVFDDIIGHQFKVFKNEEIYTGKYSGTGVYKDAEGITRSVSIDRYNSPDFTNYINRQNYWNDTSKGEYLTVTAILRANDSVYLDLMQPSIGYLSSLKEEFVGANYFSDIAFSLNKNAITVDQDAISEGLKVLSDPTYVPTDPKYADCSSIYDYINMGMKFYDPGSLSATDLESVGVSSYLDLGYKYGSDITNEYGYIPFEDENVVLATVASALTYSLVTSIVIFPKDLTAKTDIMSYLDKWNNEHNKESEKVYYTDTIGSITDSLAIMIQVISSVLIAFASSALVVSCVMTAIITYISVIERTKEIGVLRAIGARKKDVTRLFETENFIVGAISGIFGILVTLLISIPINCILQAIYSEQNLGNIASLRWTDAIILIVVSIVLNVLAGLIPSLIASKKDPVVALRSE